MSKASVSVAGEIVGAIGPGLCVLVGVGTDDEEIDADTLAKKLSELRVFSDADGKMNLSLLDVGGEALIVSQFTLMGDTRKGRRPSFGRAAPHEEAARLVDRVADVVRARGINVATGQFGAHMDIEIHADGPVTLLIDTKVSRRGNISTGGEKTDDRDG